MVIIQHTLTIVYFKITHYGQLRRFFVLKLQFEHNLLHNFKKKTSMSLITHSQREAYMVLVRNGGSGGGGGRQLSQNPQAIYKFCI